MKLLRGAALAGLACALGAGLWVFSRRPAPRPAEEASTPAFKAERAGPGTVLVYGEDLVPLRAITWVQGPQPGLLFAQVLTQNDRQQVTVFDGGVPAGGAAVPRPQEAGEAFFRFALLREALLLEGRRVLLLYGPDGGGREEASLLLLLDLEGRAGPWALRTPSTRIAWGGKADPGVAYLFGGASPPSRIRLPGPTQPGPAKVEALDLPAEVDPPGALLPTGPGTFLAAHARGLSAFLGPRGWVHHPPPEARGPGFKGAAPALAATAGGLWWQPSPGRLFQVQKQGAGVVEVPLEKALAGSPLERDGALLRLLGADPAGDLWFGLEPPLLPPPPPVPVPAEAPAQAPAPPAEPAPAPGVPAGLDERSAWEAHLQGGLARVYRWIPGQEALRRHRWGPWWEALGRPGGFAAPEGDGGLRPGAGALLVGGERRTAWVPLQALGPGEDPLQPR